MAKVLLRVYNVPSHLILYQLSHGCRVSLRGSVIAEQRRLERKNGWPEASRERDVVLATTLKGNLKFWRSCPGCRGEG